MVLFLVRRSEFFLIVCTRCDQNVRRMDGTMLTELHSSLATFAITLLVKFNADLLISFLFKMSQVVNSNFKIEQNVVRVLLSLKHVWLISEPVLKIFQQYSEKKNAVMLTCGSPTSITTKHNLETCPPVYKFVWHHHLPKFWSMFSGMPNKYWQFTPGTWGNNYKELLYTTNNSKIIINIGVRSCRIVLNHHEQRFLANICICKGWHDCYLTHSIL